MREHPHFAHLLALGAAAFLLAGCGPDDGPGPDDPSSGGSSSATPSGSGSTEPGFSVVDVRRALAAVDPCELLSPSSGKANDTASSDGPHTCSGDVRGARVTIEVGVPFDEADRESAQPQSVAGLAAYRLPGACRMVFAAGDSHGIAVDLDSTGCGSLAGVVDEVGTALAKDPERLVRPAGPEHFTACDLLAGAVDDPSALIDQQGSSGGLDHCEDSAGPVSSRDSLGLSHTTHSFEHLTRQLEGAAEKVAGHDIAVVDEGQDGCFVHTYLWQTQADGHGRAHTEATLSAASCERARSLARTVITAAEADPPSGGDLAGVLLTTR